MDWDYRRSVERVAKSEIYRGRSGFGFTGQASVVVNRYLADLSEWVGTSLADKRRSRDVRRAVRARSGFVRGEWKTGRLSHAQFKSIEDGAVDEAVSFQEAAGLDIVTDGEMRWLSFQSQMIEAVDGFGAWDIDAFLWGHWHGHGAVGE